MNALSLCSGIGALDMAIQSIGVQTIGYCEYDPWCGKILQHRMASGHLDSAPIWRDLKTLDGHGLPAGVELIYGGIPCQPHSNAGSRHGAEDPRDLWPATRRLLGEVQPRLFFLENVAGFATRTGNTPAFAYSVIADLAALGYVGRAGIVKAADAGAPHSRARWFCLATLVNPHRKRSIHGQVGEHSAEAGKQTLRDIGTGDIELAHTGRNSVSGQRRGRVDLGAESQGQGSSEQWEWIRPTADNGSDGLGNPHGPRDIELAYTGHDRSPAQEIGTKERPEITGRSGNGGVGNPNIEGLEGWIVGTECTGEPASRPRSRQFPPHRLADWSGVPAEWYPSIESNLRGMVDGNSVELDENRRKRLAALGNAVVPAQVLLALEHLMEAGK